MSKRTSALHLGLLVSGMVLAALAVHATGRVQIVLHGRQGNTKALAVFMKTQVPKTHWRLAVDAPPTFTNLRPLLPRGTRLKGDVIMLPNGSDFVLVKAQTPAEEKAAFQERPVTRSQLITQMQQFKTYAAKATIKCKRPGAKAFSPIGDLNRAILEAPFLPNGTYTMGDVPGKMTFAFGRLVGAPDFPHPHTGMKPGLGWSQQATSGRWEEVKVQIQTGLRWVQRADGYWEEAPIKK